MQKRHTKTMRGVFAAALTTGAVAAWTAAVLPAARADVKTVSEVTLTGLEEFGARGIATKTTHYYKNGIMREDMEARNYSHIYDSINDRYYILDRVHETYSVQTLDDLMTSASGPLAQVEVEGTSTITEGGSTSKIAGKAAKNYNTLCNLTLKLPRSGMKLLAVKIQGEQWMATTIPFPNTNTRLVRAGFLLPTTLQKVFKPYYAKVAEMKGLPLSFDLILSFQGAPGVAVSAAADRVMSGTFEAHSDVLSVDTKTLPDYLFRVPKTYKLVPRIIEKDDEG